MAWRWLGVWALAVSMFWACVFTFLLVINPVWANPVQGIPKELIPTPGPYDIYTLVAILGEMI